MIKIINSEWDWERFTESASCITDPKDIEESGDRQDKPNHGVDKERDEDSTEGVKKFWGKVRMKSRVLGILCNYIITENLKS